VQELEPGHRSAQQCCQGRIGGACVSATHHDRVHTISIVDHTVVKQANRAMGGSFSRLLCFRKYASRRRSPQVEPSWIVRFQFCLMQMLSGPYRGGARHCGGGPAQELTARRALR
jgi:hypothetical protein